MFQAGGMVKGGRALSTPGNQTPDMSFKDAAVFLRSPLLLQHTGELAAGYVLKVNSGFLFSNRQACARLDLACRICDSRNQFMQRGAREQAR